MREMPYPATPPPDHERHDPLLVSQLAAGDELPPEEQAQAEWLVASCQDCRALADDLRAIARAVATEPAPARPRDFRLSREQAERARGSRVRRFLDRLRLPEVAVLRPLAGAALALGLLLMAVGTIVPAPLVPASDAPVPLVQAATPSGAEGAPADVVLKAPGPEASAKAAPNDSTMAGSAAAVSGVTAAGEADVTAAGESTVPLLEMAVPSGSLPAMDTSAGAADRAVEPGSVASPETIGQDVASPAAVAAPVAGASTGPGAAVPAGQAGKAGADAQPVTAASAQPVAGTEAQAVTDGRAGLDDGSARSAGTPAPPASSGRDVAILLGLLLAGAGLVLAWLVWLAQRNEDPLLR